MTAPRGFLPTDADSARIEYMARERYMPEPRHERKGVALCLSGGGFRAMLFHLGALRRLNEVGLLSRVTTISSVSGGSIMSALLAERLSEWPSSGTSIASAEWEERVVAPARAFTRRNIRTGPIFKRLLPWNWLRSSAAVDALTATYEREISTRALGAIPEHPRYVLCATDLGFGVNWVFERTRVGDYQAGYAPPPPDWTLGRAVAASSAFPPLFNPMPVEREVRDSLKDGHAQEPERARVLRDLRLSDGGLYDNLALEPVWKDHAVVLCSDGGSPFAASDDRSLLQRLGRYVAVQGNQSGSVRKRWLIASFIERKMEGTYWGIATDVRNYSANAVGYSGDLAANLIARIRTDLDAFSEAEQAVLENHGYLVCAAALQAHMSNAARAMPVRPPHEDWMDESRVRHALRLSPKRKVLGRRG